MPDRSPAPGVRRLVVPGVLVALLAAGLVAFFAATPREHVAPGCFWWTATTVDRVLPNQSGCLRGWYFPTGIAEAGDQAAFRLLMLIPSHLDCRFRRGDPVVVRFESEFDDGQTVVHVTDC